jgi:hypothetical protein
MTAFYGRQSTPSSPAASMDLMRRKPVRLTFTAHWQLHQRLQRRADMEGRSLSNLIGHLLEVATAG